ncbi:alpha/beta fold hydrolase [Streptomyces sp. H10-C2]|nr:MULTISPECIES: alpha/beta fold hydrolase [unclassified Streptomyces]MDJ0347480.1 alpha/beta fold hydrolase [Streptomyces sp. PH10-H1]MDJ0375697.1 alpha/beta fold hydrolase [Streptomyces sp. H10-C2]
MAVDTESKWFRRYASQAAPRRRLLILPHAGGSAGYFHTWGHRFDADTEVLVAKYPGRQERIVEPCIESMGALADAVTAALLPFLDVPVSLFGHSMGASLAYEVALRLEDLHGVRLEALYASCRKAPHRVTPKALDVADDEAIIRQVQRLGGTDIGLLDDPDLRDLVMPAIRADFRIVKEYEPRPATPLSCPIVGYLGDQDRDVSTADMWAWADVTTRGFDLRVLPGGHFYLAEERHTVIADLVRRMA